MKRVDVIAQQLIEELKQLRLSLMDAVKEMKTYAHEQAKSEYFYKVALRKEIYRLHEEEKVAWTVTSNLAHGEEGKFEVAKKRYNRDLAKALYETSIENINAIKLNIRLLESNIDREWRG